MKHLDEMLQNPLTAVVVLLLALGLAGTDDYENAMHQQKVMCERNPQPSYCAEVAK